MPIKIKVIENRHHSVKELAADFFQLEDKYDLLNLEISGVKVWLCIRCRLFTTMAETLLASGTPSQHERKADVLKSIVPMLYRAIRHTALFQKPHEVVVFPHQRVRLVDGDYIDIYTKYFVEELLKVQTDCLVLERPYEKKHLAKSNNYTKYIDDSIIFTRLFSKFITPNMKPSETIIQELNSEIQKTFGIQIDLHALCKDTIKNFKASYKFYFYLLNRVNPKQLYVLVSYAYPSLIKAAKDLRIEVIEIQHGAFSKYHLGYSYNGKRSVAYFPDKFLAWNEFWRDLGALPLHIKDIDIYPFKFQDREVKKYDKVPRIKNQVVVLSQGNLTDRISKIILDNFNFFQDKTIKYKLHPEEKNSFRDSRFLAELLAKDNVELVDDDLYKLLSSSEYQVGVYSTAIYEGLLFGLKTILCNTMFVEYMEELIMLDKVFLVLNEKK